MGKIILFAQQKGGAGKSMLLCQLGAEFAKRGLSVAMVDLDPQRSASDWHSARTTRMGSGGGITLSESADWRASSDIREAARGAELVLLDSPGSADVLKRVAIRAADLCLIPCQPSSADFWATERTLELARAEKLLHRVVLNRVPARSRTAEAIIAELRAAEVPLLEEGLGSRAAFADSFALGAGVTETAPRTKAAAEVKAVASVVLTLV